MIGKRATSALVGTELEGKLREVGTRQLLVCGIATDHCVSTTVRAAADLEVCKGGREGVWIVGEFGRFSYLLVVFICGALLLLRPVRLYGGVL